MSMRLSVILSLVFFTYSLSADAQVKELDKASPFSNQIYRDIQNSVVAGNKDSLANLNQYGILLLKFRLGSKGIYDVSISNSAPPILLINVSNAIELVNKKWLSQLKTKDGSGWYILPITFDFKSKTKSKSFAEVLDKLPTIPDILDKPKLPDSIHLFNLSEMEANNGLSCILLPVLILRYHMVDSFN